MESSVLILGGSMSEYIIPVHEVVIESADLWGRFTASLHRSMSQGLRRQFEDAARRQAGEPLIVVGSTSTLWMPHAQRSTA